MLALPWPLLMYSTGTLLLHTISAVEFTKAMALGLLMLAEGLFILRAFAILCEKDGVAEGGG